MNIIKFISERMKKAPIDSSSTFEKLSENIDLNIPVWIQNSTQTPTDFTFSHEGLWQVDPMGEYIYYLAGDFAKNEKGQLLLQTSQTHAQVLVSFERDFIDVARQDMQGLKAMSEIDKPTLQDTLSGLEQFLPQDSQFPGGKIMHNGNAVTLTVTTWNGTTTAYVKSLILQDCKQGLRLTEILISSTDPQMVVEKMLSAAKNLLDDYNAIKDYRLTGAIRI